MGVYEKSKVKRFFLSLLISMFIWGYVTNMHNPMGTKTLSNVPINIINPEMLVSQNLAIDTNSMSTVNVVVEGRYSDLQNITLKDVEVQMDLSDLALKEGSNNILIEVKSLNNNISIVKEKTSLQAKVDVVKLLQKEIPIVVNVTGELDTSYLTGEPVLSKDKVICTGTKEALNDIKYIAANLDISGVSEDISSLVQLTPINKVGEEATNISLKDKEVQLDLPIKFTKEVPIKINFKNSVPKGRILDSYVLDKTSITIIGSKKVLDNITSIGTEAVDLSRRYYDFDKRLYLNLPSGVETKNNITSIYGSFVVTKK